MRKEQRSAPSITIQLDAAPSRTGASQPLLPAVQRIPSTAFAQLSSSEAARAVRGSCGGVSCPRPRVISRRPSRRCAADAAFTQRPIMQRSPADKATHPAARSLHHATPPSPQPASTYSTLPVAAQFCSLVMNALVSGNLPVCSLEWSSTGCDVTPMGVCTAAVISNELVRPGAPDTRMDEPKCVSSSLRSLRYFDS